MTEEINDMINKFCNSVEKRINQYDLEKENAELKDYSQRMENQRENYYKEYLRLEQENKELKEENVNLKSLIWYIYCCGEAETIDCIVTEYYESRKTQYEKGFWKKVCALKNVPYQSKYKSALEEIREIANKFDYWNSNLPEASNVINEIKDKIDEVLK